MGMSYSTWICVDKFSDPRIDPHGIRLLTSVVRNITDRPAEGGGGQDLVCLSVVLSPKDKTLLVRTKETSLPKGNTFVRLLPVSLYLIVRLGSNDWEPTRSQHPLGYCTTRPATCRDPQGPWASASFARGPFAPQSSLLAGPAGDGTDVITDTEEPGTKPALLSKGINQLQVARLYFSF